MPMTMLRLGDPAATDQDMWAVLGLGETLNNNRVTGVIEEEVTDKKIEGKILDSYFEDFKEAGR